MTVYLTIKIILCFLIIHLIQVLFRDIKYNLRSYKRLLNKYMMSRFN